MKIYLDSRVTPFHQSLVTKYLRDPRSLSKAEWKAALAAFDLLRHCRLEQAGNEQTFAEFYEDAFDRPYAAAFLAELLAANNAEVEGALLAAQAGRRAWANLTAPELRAPQTPEQRLLVAYCLYWWNSFTKGYLAEVAIFQDLTASGIRFQAHDLTRPDGRYSPEDLWVSGLRGDIKSSTYFLQSARHWPLRHDFYIAALYDDRLRKMQRVVILQPAVWAQIDGDTQAAKLEQATALFPQPVAVTIEQQQVVVVAYEVWKEKIRAIQQ